MLQLNLEEVYMEESGSHHVTDISYKPRICLLCMQIIKGEIRCIGEDELQAVQRFVPEMNMRIIRDPFLCKPCFESLHTYVGHLEVDKKIVDIFEPSVMESQANKFPSDLCIKTEKSEINEDEVLIKTECIDIKLEDEEGSDTLLLCSNNGIFEKSDSKGAEEEEVTHMWKHKNISIDKCDIKHAEKNALERYKCEPYECVNQKDPLKVQMYKCNNCDYITKYRFNLGLHAVRHIDPSQVQMYKCDACDFKSKYKNSVTNHQRIHKEPSKVQMYKCNDCNFRTKYKGNINIHVLQHKDPSQVQVYKCGSCNYESRNKYYLTQHQLVHKDPWELQIYGCEICEYKTNRKVLLKKHKLKHKDPLELQLYSCNDCTYKTNRKQSLVSHVLRHRDSSQVQMYKCDACEFKTKYETSLCRHQLTHQDPLQVHMFKCDACDFKSKYKLNFTMHQSTHKKLSKV